MAASLGPLSRVSVPLLREASSWPSPPKEPTFLCQGLGRLLFHTWVWKSSHVFISQYCPKFYTWFPSKASSWGCMSLHRHVFLKACPSGSLVYYAFKCIYTPPPQSQGNSEIRGETHSIFSGHRTQTRSSKPMTALPRKDLRSKKPLAPKWTPGEQ